MTQPEQGQRTGMDGRQASPPGDGEMPVGAGILNRPAVEIPPDPDEVMTERAQRPRAGLDGVQHADAGLVTLKAQLPSSPQSPSSTTPDQGDEPATERTVVRPLDGGAADIVPERPELALGVELAGEMAESGFEEQQLLVRRNNSFVQLTELLYRVVEQADGQRTLDEMAAGVSAAIDRGVSAANIHQLIEQKLIPLGLIVKADGSVEGADTDSSSIGRSTLAVNLKMAMISPRVFEPVAATLRFLYLPPVLLSVLVAGGVAQWWMLFRHGLGGSVHNALYRPGLLLAALGIIILAAAFHELGHAAALRYGGARARAMGIGIYLVYPAFHTDVSENYRLRRWARVRTDLGGFYFNLLFALGVTALYIVTGFEFLLLVVVMMDFDIIRQTMPFVRLDGYWALADLTASPTSSPTWAPSCAPCRRCRSGRDGGCRI